MNIIIRLQVFYDTLISYLPQARKAYYEEIWPVITTSDYPQLLLLDASGHKLWEEAILQALDKTTDDTVPIPEGYL